MPLILGGTPISFYGLGVALDKRLLRGGIPSLAHSGWWVCVCFAAEWVGIHLHNVCSINLYKAILYIHRAARVFVPGYYQKTTNESLAVSVLQISQDNGAILLARQKTFLAVSFRRSPLTTTVRPPYTCSTRPPPTAFPGKWLGKHKKKQRKELKV